MNKKDYTTLIRIINDYSVVCVDFFDTIVHRRKSPNYVFRKFSDFLVLNYLKDIDSEKLYYSLLQFFSRCDLPIREIIINIYYHYSLDSICKLDSFYDHCFSFLKCTEMQNIIPSNYCLRFIREVVNKRIKIVVVSDYWLGQSFLKEIVIMLFGNDIFDGYFVSCDYGLTKSSSKLYEKVAEWIKPGRAIMVGDNYLLDYINALKIGFDAFRVNSRAYYQRYKKFDILYDKRVTGRLKSFMVKNDSYYSVNYVFFVFHFVKKLYSELNKRQDVYFLAREGQFLKQCFDTFLKIENNKNIITHYLPISRIAVFLASNVLTDFTFKEALNKVRHYLEWDIDYSNDFLKYIGFNDNDLSELQSYYDVDLNELIDSGTLQNIWEDNYFRKMVAQKNADSKKKFISYFDFKDKDIVIVDVGWHGTMQNLMREILPKHHNLIGYYIGTFKVDNEDICNYKKGLIFDCFDDIFYFTHSSDILIMEALLRANHGQLINYNTEGNLYIDDSGLEVYKEYSKMRQDMMYSMFITILEFNENYPIPHKALESLEHLVIRKKPFKTKVIDNYFEHYQCYWNKNINNTHPKRFMFIYLCLSKGLGYIKRLFSK